MEDVIFSIKTWKKSLVTYKEISCSLHSIYSIHSYQLCISVNLILRRWLWVVSNCDMCLLSVKMWSSLAYGLVEQGSEALGFPLAHRSDLFKYECGLQFVALCTAIGLVPRRCMYILSEYYCIGYKPVNV